MCVSYCTILIWMSWGLFQGALLDYHNILYKKTMQDSFKGQIDIGTSVGKSGDCKIILLFSFASTDASLILLCFMRILPLYRLNSYILCLDIRNDSKAVRFNDHDFKTMLNSWAPATSLLTQPKGSLKRPQRDGPGCSNMLIFSPANLISDMKFASRWKYWTSESRSNLSNIQKHTKKHSLYSTKVLLV